jgi:hypothetical protein
VFSKYILFFCGPRYKIQNKIYVLYRNMKRLTVFFLNQSFPLEIKTLFGTWSYSNTQFPTKKRWRQETPHCSFTLRSSEEQLNVLRSHTLESSLKPLGSQEGKAHRWLLGVAWWREYSWLWEGEGHEYFLGWAAYDCPICYFLGLALDDLD